MRCMKVQEVNFTFRSATEGRLNPPMNGESRGLQVEGVIRLLLQRGSVAITPFFFSADVKPDPLVDGDTIRVRLPDGQEEPLRYIGINTPE